MQVYTVYLQWIMHQAMHFMWRNLSKKASFDGHLRNFSLFWGNMEENHIKTVLRHKTTSPKFHSRLNTPFSNFALSHLRYPQFSLSYEWWRIVFSSLCKLFYRIIKIIIIVRTSWECIFHVWVDNAPYIYISLSYM